MQVIFKIGKANTSMGQNVFVVGSAPAVASWKFQNAHRMSTKKGMYPAWESKAPIMINSKAESQSLEYKYIIMDDKTRTNPRWEGGDNRKVDLSSYFDQATSGGDKVVVLEDGNFDETGRKTKISISGGGSGSGDPE